MSEPRQISEKKLKGYSYFSQGIIGRKLAQDNPYPSGSTEATAWNDGYTADVKFGDMTKYGVYEDIYA